ncbi:MAG: DUF1592 domain-containing protein [Myxococcota bacterium]
MRFLSRLLPALVLVLACSKSRSRTDAGATPDGAFDATVDAGVDAVLPMGCAAPACEPRRFDTQVRPRLVPPDVLANIVTAQFDTSWEVAGERGRVGPFAFPDPSPVYFDRLLQSALPAAAARANTIEAACEADPDCVVAMVFSDLATLTRSERTVDADSIRAAFARGTTPRALLLQGLLAPQFFTVRLTQTGLAERMTFALWREAPDPSVEALIADPEALVDRVLSDPRAAQGIERFHREWLRTDRASSPLADLMQRETELYVQNVFLEDGTYRDLVGAPYTFVNDELAAFYGLEARTSEFEQVALDPARASLFAHGSLTAGRSIPLRAAFLGNNVLCQELPPPPADIDPDPEPAPGDTRRERYEAIVSHPDCAGCHALFDSFGFAFESIGPEGRTVAEDMGRPIDDTFAMTSCVGTDEGISGAGIETMTSWLAESESAHDCYLRQWVRFMFAAEPIPCLVSEIDFSPAQSSLRQMFVNLASHPRVQSAALPPFGERVLELRAVGPEEELSIALRNTIESLESDDPTEFEQRILESFYELEARVR